MATLEIGVALPDVGEIDRIGTGGIGVCARHAEDLGFESVWVSDLIVGDGSPSLESMVTLAMAAAATRRVRLGFGVLVLPLRPVAWVAAQVSTLQHVSDGRVLLGVGSGGFPEAPFWRAVGVSRRERGRRTDAALEVLPRLIGGVPTRLGHEPGQPELTLAPAAAVPPLLIGGNSDVAIRRAVTYGDAWYPSLIAPDTLATRAGKLREMAAARERPVPGLTVGGHVLLGPEATDRDAFVRSLVDDHGMSFHEAEMAAITGAPRELAERFAAYADAGAERLVLAPTGGQWMRQCELLAEAAALVR